MDHSGANNPNHNILIVAPSWVGDMVMAQSLFKILKCRHPQVNIDLLASNWAGLLTMRMPEVRQAYDLPIGHGKLKLKLRYQIGKDLRQQRYNQAIVLPNSFKSALIPFWAHIPQRTGWQGEIRWGLLNDARSLDKQKLPLMIERFASLGIAKDETLPRDLPRPQLVVNEKILAATLEKYRLRPQQRLILALCPGAEYGPAKRWPTAHFAELARRKLAEGWQVWLFGSGKDRRLAQEIQQQTKGACIDLIGKTDLAEAIDLLSISDAVVSNDSGLMHIAAALNRPLVVIYGSSSPRFTPPLHDKVKILSLALECSPCFKRICPLGHRHCLTELKPQQVLTALSELVDD